MTKQKYKIGDKVLVEGLIVDTDNDDSYEIELLGDDQTVWVPFNPLRPYAPRQEFEYGEEVWAKELINTNWEKALFIGKTHYKGRTLFPYCVNYYDELGSPKLSTSVSEVRKIINTKPRDTITIAGATYYKDDVEAATKYLEPVEGK